ncbi:hypothetical protein OG828_03310 [Streptomyces sp. NBC_00457]|uniref:hypothetical protein n=1 Tax=unclassified Streptomyces TaxID=2593676 RepID=UPI002E20AF04|nr:MULTISPECIES: hypothetical protein [unclassified Streptomyces]
MTTSSASPGSNEHVIPATGARYGDPLGGLVQAAVADRPLEEVAHLITLLEQSPQYAQATVDALRAVGVTRSVEDVTRLVILLTRPPRDAGCADEAIRAAAGARPVEEVTRLMDLMHRAPLEPHCGQEAIRAVATGRPVEELVELIGRLAVARSAESVDEPPDWPPFGQGPEGAPTLGAVPPPPPGRPPSVNRAPRWPSRLSVAALAVCGLLWFPPQRDGASPQVYGFALGVSALCLFLALLLTVRAALPLLAAAVVVPAALAATQVFEAWLDSPDLSWALDLTLAPSWATGLTAVCAALAALIALLVNLAAQSPGADSVARLMAEAQRAADAPRTAQAHRTGD